MATLLSIVQDVTTRIGVPKPSTVADNTSRSVIQLLAIANEVGELLGKRDFKSLERRVTFTSTGSELQGAVSTILPEADPASPRVIGETAWDLTSAMYMGNVPSPQEWEFRKVRNITGPTYRFRLMTDPDTLDNSIYLNPAPAAGHSMGLEYFSNFWCKSEAGEGQTAFAADTDILLLPEACFKAEMKWRWKREKGLPYDDERADAEELTDTAVAQSNPQGAFSIDQNTDPVLIGPWNLPDGNFNQ